MATENVSQSYHGLTTDDANRLQSASAQLCAMLTHAYGGSGEAFRDMNNELQDNYLWACSNMADRVESLASMMRAVGIPQKTVVDQPAEKTQLEDLIHEQNDELHDVVTLLDAAAVQEFDGQRLIRMAINKVQAIQDKLQPYI